MPAEAVQTSPLPTVDFFDDRSGGTDHPFGYVYFVEANFDGDTVRLGYVGGVADPNGETPVSREAPLLFQANWGEAHAGHFLAAWRAMIEAKVPGFAEADPDFVRVSVKAGDTVIETWPTWHLEEVASREFKQFTRKLKTILNASKKVGKKTGHRSLGQTVKQYGDPQ